MFTFEDSGSEPISAGPGRRGWITIGIGGFLAFVLGVTTLVWLARPGLAVVPDTVRLHRAHVLDARVALSGAALDTWAVHDALGLDLDSERPTVDACSGDWAQLPDPLLDDEAGSRLTGADLVFNRPANELRSDVTRMSVTLTARGWVVDSTDGYGAHSLHKDFPRERALAVIDHEPADQLAGADQSIELVAGIVDDVC